MALFYLFQQLLVRSHYLDVHVFKVALFTLGQFYDWSCAREVIIEGYQWNRSVYILATKTKQTKNKKKKQN